MRILFVTNMFPSGEKPVFGIFVKEQIEDITARLSCKYDVYYIKSALRGNLMYLVSLFRIPFKLLTQSFDVVHIHYGISAAFLLFFRPKAKVFLTLHGADILPRQKKKFQVLLTRHLLRKVDTVFILNQEMEEIVRPLAARYELLPCGVNTDFFLPSDQDGRRRGKLILFPGDPGVAVKNFPLFREVVGQLQKTTNHAVIYRCIYGLGRKEVRDLLCAADCILMTSISEGSPQVVKEALSCGLPVVSVDVGDVKQMTTGIPSCFISETYDAGELARLVTRACDGKGPGIREAFLQKKTYDHHSVSTRIIGHYQSAIAAK
jgi:glycosyltransferase involved in cell wall biosynthesis